MTSPFSLRDLLDDLHKLEINTIEKSTMTAQKMPPPLLALFETIETYESYLCWSIHGETYDFAKASQDKTGDAPNDSLTDRLCKAMEAAETRFQALANDRTDTRQADRMICGRIGRSCEFLLGMISRADKAAGVAPDSGRTTSIDPAFRQMTATELRRADPAAVAAGWRLSSADSAYLRKIWEIGTEKVLIQTVIQIEGDVINRISPLIADQKRQYLLDIHKDGIETSLKMWGELVSVAERIVSFTARSVGRLFGA